MFYFKKRIESGVWIASICSIFLLDYFNKDIFNVISQSQKFDSVILWTFRKFIKDFPCIMDDELILQIYLPYSRVVILKYGWKMK